MQYLVNPLTGCEVTAFVQAVLALAFLSVWLKDHERGLVWLAAGYALMAASVLTPVQIPGDALHVKSRHWVGFNLLGMTVLAVGIIRHLKLLSSRLQHTLLVLLIFPLVVMVTFLAADVPLTRVALVSGITFSSAVLSAMCMLAGRQERVNGHYGAGLALLAIPAVCWVTFLSRSDPAVFRTLVALPGLPLGLALLISTLQRRQRALELQVSLRTKAEDNLRKLNSSLEEKVSQRTADLRSMLSGLESFNRSVSHDLRGPLGSMASLARMANKALDNGDMSLAQRVLPDMAKQAEALHRMVNSLLELARVSDLHLKLNPVQLDQVVNQVVSDLAMANPNLPVKACVNIGLLPQVASDSDMLVPIFVNLIGNALKFAKPGEAPKVEVGVLPTHALHEITVFVRDHGMGFDESRSEELFKPFTRLHGQVVEGHGVGLSIVSRAVDRLGGRIWARSAPGEGACFYFTLPRLV